MNTIDRGFSVCGKGMMDVLDALWLEKWPK